MSVATERGPLLGLPRLIPLALQRRRLEAENSRAHEPLGSIHPDDFFGQKEKAPVLLGTSGVWEVEVSTTPPSNAAARVSPGLCQYPSHCCQHALKSKSHEKILLNDTEAGLQRIPFQRSGSNDLSLGIWQYVGLDNYQYHFDVYLLIWYYGYMPGKWDHNIIHNYCLYLDAQLT